MSIQLEGDALSTPIEQTPCAHVEVLAEKILKTINSCGCNDAQRCCLALVELGIRDLIASQFTVRCTSAECNRTGVLTSREREVALEVRKGNSNKEIASHLFISSNTVRFHVNNLFRKFNVRNRTELAAVLVHHI
ncbi:MAG: response regulator transcription factor [Alcaligenaceae bacterium]|nr:MAG: response regulator transcription factor [Alcaligenaceae bacterium]